MATKRNTKRNTNKRQMELVPTSVNMALRQSERLRAVVSLRLQGALIAMVDDCVQRINERGGPFNAGMAGGASRRYEMTRSEFMERAIKEAVEREVGSHGDLDKQARKRKGRKS